MILVEDQILGTVDCLTGVGDETGRDMCKSVLTSMDGMDTLVTPTLGHSAILAQERAIKVSLTNSHSIRRRVRRSHRLVPALAKRGSQQRDQRCELPKLLLDVRPEELSLSIFKATKGVATAEDAEDLTPEHRCPSAVPKDHLQGSRCALSPS